MHKLHNMAYTHNRSDQFEYVTKNLVNQEFELEARAKLVKIESRIKLLSVSKQTRFKANALSFSSEFLRTKLNHIVQFLDNPQTTREFVKRLENYCSETVAENSASQQQPQTPVFRFGNENGRNVLPSTVKKTPRLAKPGEPIYAFSATGSPVIQPPTSVAVPPTCRSARVKLDGGNGNLIDVDIVYRGTVEDEKRFGKIVTDFRGWAATRSTANARRMLPPRVIVNKKRTNKSMLRKSVRNR